MKALEKQCRDLEDVISDLEERLALSHGTGSKGKVDLRLVHEERAKNLELVCA